MLPHNHFTVQNKQILILAIIIVAIRKSEIYNRRDEEIENLYKILKGGKYRYDIPAELNLSEIRDNFIPLRDDIMQSFSVRNPALQNLEIVFSFSDSTQTAFNTAQQNYRTYPIEKNLRYLLVSILVSHLKDIQAFNFLQHTFHFILMFFIKEEMEFIDNVYCHLLGKEKRENQYHLIDDALDATDYAIANLLSYAAYNPDIYLWQYFEQKQIIPSLLMKRNRHNQNYLDTLCFPFFTNNKPLTDFPPTTEGTEKLRQTITSQIRMRPEKINQLENMLLSTAPCPRIEHATYANTIPETSKGTDIPYVILPSINGYSLLAIAYIGIYHAWHMNDPDSIKQTKVIFDIILKTMSNVLGSEGKQKIIPTLINQYHSQEKTYQTVDIQQHLFVNGLKHDFKQYIFSQLNKYGFTRSLFEPISTNITAMSNNFFDKIAWELHNPFIGLSKEQTVIYRNVQTNVIQQQWP